MLQLVLLQAFPARRVCVYAIFLLMLFPVYVGVEIVVFSYHTSVESSQAAVVLGAAVHGARPSPVFEQRIKHALRLYREGRVEFLVFTGGSGEAGEPAESRIAQVYARQRGVAPDRILTESRSTTTLQNLQESREVMKRHGIKTALLVSDPLHMKRAMKIAADLGMNCRSSPTTTSMYRSWWHKSRFLLREIYFYGLYVLFGFG